MKIRKGRLAYTEVIDRRHDPQPLQLLKNGAGLAKIPDKQTLGQFEFERGRWESRLRKNRSDVIHEAGAHELHCGDVDGNTQHDPGFAAPRDALKTRLPEDPAAELEDQSRFL